VIILDPPFEMWEDVASRILSKVTKRQTVVCVSNFQNMFSIYEIMGKPRVEIIWAFPNGKWVSHKIPQLAHENIWIYGKTNESYLGGQNDSKSVVKTSSVGRWSDGRKVNTKPRTRKQINTFINTPRISEDGIGMWIKPPALARTLVEYACWDGCRVLDAFAGAGGFSCILDEYDLKFDAYEKDAGICTALRHKLSVPQLFKKSIVNAKVKEDPTSDMFRNDTNDH
jgi:hypothetical protein